MEIFRPYVSYPIFIAPMIYCTAEANAKQTTACWHCEFLYAKKSPAFARIKGEKFNVYNSQGGALIWLKR